MGGTNVSDVGKKCCTKGMLPLRRCGWVGLVMALYSVARAATAKTLGPKKSAVSAKTAASFTGIHAVPKEKTDKN